MCSADGGSFDGDIHKKKLFEGEEGAWGWCTSVCSRRSVSRTNSRTKTDIQRRLFPWKIIPSNVLPLYIGDPGV